MARVVAHDFLWMDSQAVTFQGTPLIATDSQIRVASSPAVWTDYFGQFVYDGTTHDVVGGAINRIAGNVANGVVGYDLTDFVLPVPLANDSTTSWLSESSVFDGNDAITGSASIFGDHLFGGTGHDVISSNGGNDVINGGSDLDVAVMPGMRSTYAMNHGAQTLLITDGTNTCWLTEIERVQFTDGTLVVDPSDAAFQVFRLYQAALGRVPDQAGLTSWTYAATTGLSMNVMAQMFMFSPEFQTRFGQVDNAHFVDLLYNNILGRTGDPAGATAWTYALDSGALTRDEVLLGFSESVENIGIVNSHIGDGVWLG